MPPEPQILVRSPLRERPRVAAALVVLGLVVAALFVGVGALAGGGSSGVPPETARALSHARAQAASNDRRARHVTVELAAAKRRIAKLERELRASRARERKAVSSGGKSHSRRGSGKRRKK